MGKPLTRPEVVVAGHTCLDILPTLPEGEHELADVLAPGKLRQVGPLALATGGAAPNTGLALQRLGTPVRIVGKVGDDFVGRAILAQIAAQAEALAEDMVVISDAASSYTIILSSPGLDRTFFHYPGPNDTFGAADILPAALEGARLLHFGYPTLMRRMYRDGGRELVTLLGRARQSGLVTSLDVTQPDPDSEAGRVDWQALLTEALPQVDIFLPSVEEALWMLDRGRHRALAKNSGTDLPGALDGALLNNLASRALDLGATLVGLKLGDQGLYLRTSADHARNAALADRLGLPRRDWLNRELLAPAFAAELVGTTGAGDCAVAGFLTGLLRGLKPSGTLEAATAVGACNVEAADAVSGVPAWTAVQARLQAGWAQVPTRLRLRGWGWDPDRRLWIGPRDRGGLLAATPDG